jgi:protein phosphatase
MNVTLRWGAATHAGRVREANEDSFLAQDMVFAVADGMGGHQAGEVASAMAADVLRDRLTTGAPSTDVLVAAVVEANAAIFQTARRNSSQLGMGTTITVLAIVPGVDGTPPHLAVANVGDSRTYLLRSGALTRETVDHSYVQELLDTGHITEDEARNHPRRNIVTRALGIEPSVRVDAWPLPLVRGDRFILCSDGLVDEVDDTAIRDLALAHPDPQAAANQLVAIAVDNGGRDNVTVIVVDILEGDDPATHDAASGSTDPAAHPSGHPTAQLPVVGGVAADPLAPDTPPPARTGGRLAGRIPQMTGRTFAFLLVVAVVLTVIITLVAVAVTRSGDSPTPTTVPTTSTTPASTTPTTAPASSTTAGSGPSTTGP